MNRRCSIADFHKLPLVYALLRRSWGISYYMFVVIMVHGKLNPQHVMGERQGGHGPLEGF